MFKDLPEDFGTLNYIHQPPFVGSGIKDFAIPNSSLFDPPPLLRRWCRF